MITIDSLIGQMKSLFAIKTPVRFDTPEYIQFYNDLIQYIYENHFEESDEWKIISRNLVYTSKNWIQFLQLHKKTPKRIADIQWFLPQ